MRERLHRSAIVAPVPAVIPAERKRKTASQLFCAEVGVALGLATSVEVSVGAAASVGVGIGVGFDIAWAKVWAWGTLQV
jgi:hypothetical protein